MKKINIYLMATLVFLTTFANVQAQTAADMPAGRSFIIQSAQNFGRDAKGCWDLAGSYTTESQFIKGKNIQIWQLGSVQPDRIYTLVESSHQGYYEIMVGRHSVARVDVSGGKLKKGDNIQLWDDNNSKAQRFLFKHLGNGRFKIYNANGKIVNLSSKNSNNGNNIHIWDDHN